MDVWINMPSVTVTACSVGLEHFNIVKVFHSSTRYIGVRSGLIVAQSLSHGWSDKFFCYIKTCSLKL